MLNKKLLHGSMASIVLAAVAASLLTVAGAIDVPHLNKNTASGRLAVTCGLAYDKVAYKELHSVLNKQAAALEKLGLGETKADVCAEVVKVANAKKNPKVDYVQYAHAAYSGQALVSAAMLYRTSALGASLDKATMKVVGDALDVPEKTIAGWKTGVAGQAMVREEGKAFISSALAQANQGDIDWTSIKDSKFSSYVDNLNLTY